jgi:M6 family metalloprotease-like protein
MMKEHLAIRSLIFLLLVPVLVLLTDPHTALEGSSLPAVSYSPPRAPMPIERLMNPFSYPGFPPSQTISEIQSIQDPIPTTGNQPLLVVLVDFEDQQGSFTLQEWGDYFFGLGGFVDYFNEVSHGNLRYNGDVVGMLNDRAIIEATSIAYVRLPYPIWYYAYGIYGFGSVFPFNNAGVVYDALRILDASGFDYLPYSDPRSGRVENLVVIFAGSNYGYTGDPYYSLEATAFSLTQGGMPGGFVSEEGVLFDNFTFCPEKFGALEGEIAHLGVCVHEHGHALGMFDLYDRSNVTTGIGRFDLMSYGGYGADSYGSRPFHPGVFTKEYLGWAEPTVILGDYQELFLGPAESVFDFIKIYPRGDTDVGEYFLLENRQPIGFDSEWLPQYNLCSGLVIWHVDERIVNDYAFVNRVNTTGVEPYYPPHPGVIIVEADGRYDMINSLNFGECSDTWQVGSTWDDLSVPPARLWDRSASRISVTILYQIGSYLRLAIEVEHPVFNYQMYLPAIEK